MAVCRKGFAIVVTFCGGDTQSLRWGVVPVVSTADLQKLCMQGHTCGAVWERNMHMLGCVRQSRFSRILQFFPKVEELYGAAQDIIVAAVVGLFLCCNKVKRFPC